jgi:very-short-patch-repair endonuclease
MTERRAPLPSPPAGEGASRLRREAGEGAVATSRARELRSRMTDAERKLWFALRDRRFANFKFRRQVPLGPFIADFVCFDARLVVEVDGGQHAESRSDERRDQWFVANGFVVRRFWNNDVLENLEGVLTSILGILREGTPHPDRASRGRPSPAGGEGDGANGAATARAATARDEER